MVERAGTPFELWAQQEGIPIIRGYSVKDMYQVPLAEWRRKGGLGALIILEGGEGWINAYLCEIPPRTSLKPQRHFFEEEIYILKGQGETRVWAEGFREQRFAWREYSLFSPPLNAWHQHINTGKEPARYVAVTNAPTMFNLLATPDFIFNADVVLKERLVPWEGLFSGAGKIVDNEWPEWQAGLIPDVRKIALPESVMGEHLGMIFLKLSGNRLVGHLAQLEAGHYKKTHRHGGGAHIIVVSGEGYSLIWKEGGEKVRVDWQKGSIYSPPEAWWHVHFNTGQEPAKQVALRYGSLGIGKIYKPGVDVKKGGDQIEYEDEDPELRKMFEQELAEKGLPIKMSPAARKTKGRKRG